MNNTIGIHVYFGISDFYLKKIKGTSEKILCLFKINFTISLESYYTTQSL